MFQLPEAAFAVLRDLRDPLLLGALERLQLRSRKPLAGQLLGSHRSRRHGSSLDFADFRDYQPGDDFRRIDYLTLARLDQLVIRLYEAEDDITVRLMVDCSASMRLDQKLQRAAELAGAIGFVALTRRDRVEVHVSGRPPPASVAEREWARYLIFLRPFKRTDRDLWLQPHRPCCISKSRRA